VITALAEATDRLTATIVALEAWLQSMELGVTAVVPLLDKNLRFGKDGRDWRLAVECKDGSGVRLLLESSRQLRVAAIYEIPALVKALKSESETKLGEVLAAVDFAETLMRKTL